MPLRFLWISFFTLCSSLLFAQSEALLDFNQTRLQKQKRAMTVLGTWAVANIAVGAALQGNREGSDKYFHQMNIGWNAVNLGIAALGYWGVARTDPAALDLSQSISEAHRFQKILLFNAGLDVGYMLGGAYLIERAKNTAPDKNPARLDGFGRSIVLQGAFLFVFDLATFWYLAADNKEIPELLSQISVQPNGIGLKIRF